MKFKEEIFIKEKMVGMKEDTLITKRTKLFQYMEKLKKKLKVKYNLKKLKPCLFAMLQRNGLIVLKKL